ncbi:16S rRNA (uracil(1498)-N(3))-methyltransferase [Sphingomicrobium lutaoense]|uniref:Ribosomal RNA small subunit methyltransferase E n=1 Tax=Sphingomicrobium lutaoense TaxID=515949 RepID=A0A839YW29_9SPHN|nr:16S rRNA (uracil(1498)-N(3))-methyltransferase [Sphingomicrobium lutaoense]MBB3764421.1 16S rRNA (uracil1498-N3)-methyltransferase [Sphingomicrobium lutaoense]
MPATPAWPPTSGPRLFVDQPLQPGALVTLDKAQANYLFNVMRLGEGDTLLAFNGSDGEWLVTVEEAGRKKMSLRAERQTSEQERLLDVTLAFAPIKKGRIDWLVEKAVELGASRLLPVVTQRTIVRDVKMDRLEAHAIEAAEQCGRTAVARLDPPMKLEAMLKAHDGHPLYFADETGGAPAIDSFAPAPATLLVGPEGGFTPEEAEAIRRAPGATAISLGPRILRAETAALAALAAFMASTGDWK